MSFLFRKLESFVNKCVSYIVSFIVSGDHPDGSLFGAYEHYKSGDLYLVLGVVMHTETSETMVLYQAANPSKESRERNPYNMTFVRPLDMFTGMVDHEGNQVKRFERIEKYTLIRSRRRRDDETALPIGEDRV